MMPSNREAGNSEIEMGSDEATRLLRDVPRFVRLQMRTGEEPRDFESFRKEVGTRYNLDEDEAHQVATHLNDFGWSSSAPDAFVGKRILDVGAGMAGSIRREVENVTESLGERAEYITVDEMPYGANTVQAKAEELPFKDGSMDIVVARNSVPIMQASERRMDDVRRAVREMVRVLAPGGELRIFPLGSYSNRFIGHRNESGVLVNNAWVEQQGVVLSEIEEIRRDTPKLDVEVLMRKGEEDGDIKTSLILRKSK